MKHSRRITFFLLGLFLLAQFIGIGILHQYIDPAASNDAGQTMFKDLPFGERPPIEERTSYIPIALAIIIGTVLALLLARLNLNWLWKAWFLIAILIALTVAFSAFFSVWVAVALALVIGVLKVFKPSFFIHTLGELFIYGGLAVVFVPLLNLWSVSVLLILLAGYDAYAVWKSKHMIKLAKSQTKAKIFAGLVIPYKVREDVVTRKKRVKGKLVRARRPKQKTVGKVRSAILGGGDIGFPLIFTGVVFQQWGLWQAMLLPIFSGAGLLFLLLWGKEKKFYPAMPFIGAGCFVGLLAVWLIGIVV